MYISTESVKWTKNDILTESVKWTKNYWQAQGFHQLWCVYVCFSSLCALGCPQFSPSLQCVLTRFSVWMYLLYIQNLILNKNNATNQNRTLLCFLLFFKHSISITFFKYDFLLIDKYSLHITSVISIWRVIVNDFRKEGCGETSVVVKYLIYNSPL